MTTSHSKTFLADWIRRQIPSREQLEKVPLIRPLARRTELFRLTRRSVPRGVAIGLLVGILAMIPGVQIVGAALLCVPCRGNIPLAAGMTFLSNPATTPFILLGSLYIGSGLGYHTDIATFNGLYERGASFDDWTAWLFSDAAPALLLGLFTIAVVTAAVGYLLSSFIWRGMVARKRRHRLTGGIAPNLTKIPAE